MPDANYTLFKTNGLRVAGLMTMPQSALDMNIPPAWLGYVGVDDVDASAKKLEKLGGTVHRQPEDIPGVGRFAVVADPHGAVFALFGTDDGDMPDIKQMDPGSIGWHELMAGDLATDFPSTRKCSAGRRTRLWIWARWASTSSSPTMAPRSAA